MKTLILKFIPKSDHRDQRVSCRTWWGVVRFYPWKYELSVDDNILHAAITYMYDTGSGSETLKDRILIGQIGSDTYVAMFKPEDKSDD